MVALNFSARNVKPNAALEPIPSGQYPVTITKSEKKPTKSGTGTYLELEMTVQGGEFAGRKVFDRLNLENPNQTAVDIAYATLSAICHVTGRLDIQESSQLHGVPFVAVVVKKKRDDNPDAYSNEVKGYKDINGNDPGFSGAVAQPSAQPGWAGSPGQAPQGQVQSWGAPQGQAQMQPQMQQQGQMQMQPQIQPAGPAATGSAPPWAG